MTTRTPGSIFTKTSPLKFLLGLVLVLAIMYFGKILFIPLFFAVLISFVIYPICKWLEKKGVSHSLAIGISLFISFLPIAGVVYILVLQVAEISESWAFISAKLQQVTGFVALPDIQSMDTVQKEEWLKNLFLKNSSKVYSGALSSMTVLVQLAIIPFYVALILYHRSKLLVFLQHLFPDSEAQRVKIILQETVVAYFNFVKGMLLVYLIVGILNSVGLALLGIPHAILYGFTASILTFIPYVGIMIGSVMPVITAWALHDSIYYPLGVVAIFAFVQFLEANFIFPLAVSSRIKINTLAILVAIFLGGIIWGAAGMILFIPFVAILKLIADKVEQLQPLGKLLGGEK
jgi:predicted PurR-regulated permease PerM